MLHTLLKVLAYTPHAAYNAPPRRHHHRQSQVTLSAPDGVRVVHEDASYFFVEKPGGLCVAGDVDSSVESFHEQVKRHALRYGSYQPGLLHRLDRGTTGLMVYAKTLESARHYLRLQQERGAIVKDYLAVVHGEPPSDSGRVAGGICKSRDLRSFVVRGRGSGKPVLTTYKRLASAEHPRLGAVSSLSLRLFTGRKHQIRASCRKLGCPIVGDSQYGGEVLPGGQLLLHARRVAFLGADGVVYDVACPPREWEGAGLGLGVGGELALLPDELWRESCAQGTGEDREHSTTG